MFWSEERDVRVVVHGDDFTFEGPEDELKKVKEEMESWWDIKVRAVMGDEAGDDKEATILNRTVRWTNEGVEWEADPKHAKIIMEEMGIEEESKGVRSPISREGKVEEGDEEELTREEASRYRRVSARANYLSADRPDIQYAVKEICRGMAKPTIKH